MRKSEIFESFIKIAEEKGIVVDKKAPEKAIEKLRKTHRHDYLSADDIEKLYNIKPDAPKSMEYKNNIMEDAHPDPVLLMPAHDKLHGLFENNNEQKSIILNILNRNNNGQLKAHKFAEKELILNLVRLGNDLDNKNKQDLMKLADVCLKQLNREPLTKEAQYLEGAAAAVAILGVIYLQQHLNFNNNGFKQNSANLIDELNDLINSNSKFGAGYDYKPEFVAQMQDFKNRLIDLSNTVEATSAVIDQVQKIQDTESLLQVAQQPEGIEAKEAYKALRGKVVNITAMFTKIMKNFSSETYKQSQIVDKGILTKLVDKTQILHGGYGLVADDFDDVVGALVPYRQSLVDICKALKGADSVVKKAQEDLQENLSDLQKDFSIDSENNITNKEISNNNVSLKDRATGIIDKVKQYSPKV